MAKRKKTRGGTPMGTFRCKRCKRTFSMAAHLARHMTATHGAGAKKKTKAAKNGRRKKRRGGRPKGSRFGLGSMTLGQLADVIDAAKAEARTRLRELEAAL